MNLKLFASVALVAFLTACGGGGGGSTTNTPPPVVTAPTITNFSGPASVNFGQTATLAWTLGGGTPTTVTITGPQFPLSAGYTYNDTTLTVVDPASISVPLYRSKDVLLPFEPLGVGSQIKGSFIPEGTTISALGTGTGMAGTYILSNKVTGTGNIDTDGVGVPILATGAYPISGNSAEVHPRNRETYTLTVSNSAGSATATWTVAAGGVDFLTNWTEYYGEGRPAGFDANGNLLIYNITSSGGFYAYNYQTGITSNFFGGNVGNDLLFPCDPVLNPVDKMLYFVDSNGLEKLDPTQDTTGSLIPYTLVNAFFNTNLNANNLVFDQAGTLYISGSLTNTIYKLLPPYTTQTVFAQGGDLHGPTGMVLDSTGNLYVNNASMGLKSVIVNGIPGVQNIPSASLAMITPAGLVSIIAGTPGVYGHQDGPAAQALFTNTQSIVLNEKTGKLYIVDSGADLIRVLDLASMQVSTLCGTMNPDTTTPNSPAVPGSLTAANLGNPLNMALTPAGDLIINSERSTSSIGSAQILQITLP